MLREVVKFCNDFVMKLKDKSRELAEKVEYAKEQEKIAKESETKKEELRNRALETIKEYVWDTCFLIYINLITIFTRTSVALE